VIYCGGHSEGFLPDVPNEPHSAPVGKSLWRLSVDVLQQPLTVLNSEMNLVGQRQLLVRDSEGFDEDWQRHRFSVCPGITCL
jgi:lipopolysaccharide/colanic/teichoic acid biosynthesis glycosyltransferase